LAESYNVICTLADLFVIVKNTNKQLAHEITVIKFVVTTIITANITTTIDGPLLNTMSHPV
jgi:hypothetical protein